MTIILKFISYKKKEFQMSKNQYLKSQKIH